MDDGSSSPTAAARRGRGGEHRGKTKAARLAMPPIRWRGHRWSSGTTLTERCRPAGGMAMASLI